MKFKKTALLAALASVAFLAGAPSAFATTFKVAVGDAQGGTQWELATTFKKAFEQKTGGKHKLDLFPNGQLGSEEETINNAAMGTLDFSILAVNNITPFSPTVGILTLPYVIQSLDEAKKTGLTFVKKQFLPRTGIQYADLVDLLVTRIQGALEAPLGIHTAPSFCLCGFVVLSSAPRPRCYCCV